MLVSLTSICALLLTATGVQAYPPIPGLDRFPKFHKFAISVHLPAGGKCESQEYKTAQGVTVLDGQCQSFPPFKAFSYTKSPLTKWEPDPRDYDCEVSVFGEAGCDGQQVIFFDNGDDPKNFGKCWDETNKFNQMSARSVKVSC